MPQVFCILTLVIQTRTRNFCPNYGLASTVYFAALGFVR
jgi:hypothetical protein